MRSRFGAGLCVAAALAAGCDCSGRFNANDSATICVVLQTCFPREFDFLWGGSLARCTTSTPSFFPPPGAVENWPIVQTGLEAPFQELYRCILGAGGDCSRAGKCLALAGPPGECSPPAGLAAGQCTGTLLGACSADGYAFSVECARYGATCTNGSFLISYDTCAVGTCTSQNATVCRGSRAESCAGNAVALVDCGRRGRACGPSPSGGVTCVGSRPCDAGLPNRCEGSVAVSCESDGFESRVDCASLPTTRRCDSGRCVATGRDCSDQTAVCEGAAVRFCQDGVVQHVNCLALGYLSCDKGRCVPR